MTKLSILGITDWLDAIGNPSVVYIHPYDFMAMDSFLGKQSRVLPESHMPSQSIRFEGTTIFPNNHAIFIGGQFGWTG